MALINILFLLAKFIHFFLSKKIFCFDFKTIPFKPNFLQSFKVLIQELRSIGLDLSTYKIDEFGSDCYSDIEVNLIENYDPLLKTFSHTANINNISF